VRPARQPRREPRPARRGLHRRARARPLSGGVGRCRPAPKAGGYRWTTLWVPLDVAGDAGRRPDLPGPGCGPSSTRASRPSFASRPRWPPATAPAARAAGRRRPRLVLATPGGLFAPCRGAYARSVES
jgi:hypothetical protein